LNVPVTNIGCKEVERVLGASIALLHHLSMRRMMRAMRGVWVEENTLKEDIFLPFFKPTTDREKGEAKKKCCCC